MCRGKEKKSGLDEENRIREDVEDRDEMEKR